LTEIAGWIALLCTCVAATMTSLNLGARFTGYSLIVFTFGAIGWIIVGLGSGQIQILYSNAFLFVVDVFGIWRWLGHRS
jgi:hypothetical protein